VSVYYQRRALAEDKKSKKVISDVLAIIKKAQELNIRVERIPYTELVKLSYQNQEVYLYHRTPPHTTATAQICCQNKTITRNLLIRAGLSVPKGYLLKDGDSAEYQLEIFDKLKKPLVVKAIDGSEAIAVTTNIKIQQQYLAALKESFAYDRSSEKRALVERMFDGKEYRILTNREQVVSIIERLPANVWGDGQRSIKELIEFKNKDQKRGSKKEDKPLFKIEIDQKMKDFLAKNKLSLSTVPKKNQQVFLRPHSSLNISLGGDTIDVTDQVHPSVKKIAIKAVQAIPGLTWSGIDFLTKDIYSSQKSEDYAILELNSSPRLIWQAEPYAGKKQAVLEAFLKNIFPNLLE
jgi:D-alanine-D-alanine ligase-like ATP-grasp enzyme